MVRLELELPEELGPTRDEASTSTGISSNPGMVENRREAEPIEAGTEQPVVVRWLATWAGH